MNLFRLVWADIYDPDIAYRQYLGERDAIAHLYFALGANKNCRIFDMHGEEFKFGPGITIEDMKIYSA
jgi:hypothetical protein